MSSITNLQCTLRHLLEMDVGTDVYGWQSEFYDCLFIWEKCGFVGGIYEVMNRAGTF